jgi:hypothetical protein
LIGGRASAIADADEPESKRKQFISSLVATYKIWLNIRLEKYSPSSHPDDDTINPVGMLAMKELSESTGGLGMCFSESSTSTLKSSLKNVFLAWRVDFSGLSLSMSDVLTAFSTRERACLPASYVSIN